MIAPATTDLAMLSTHAWALAAAVACAFGISVLLVVTKRHHGRYTMDSELGVQKVHEHPTPRVGGLGIYAGLILACALAPDNEVRHVLLTVLVAGLPALAFGLMEDVTKRVGVRTRLLATMASGALAWAISGIALNRVDVPGVDALMQFTPFAVLFTAFAVSGVANAINIIDGFHGLASGTTIIALLAMGAIACRANDPHLAVACVGIAVAVGGFLLVNYPWGKLFLGDGGAYFAGFALAWMAVLLPVRNPEVSVWAGLLVCAYPVIEVLYSVVRRRRNRQSPGAPDSRHLHSLIMSAVISKRWPNLKTGVQNAAVSPIVWAFTLVPAVFALALFDRSVWLAAALAVCVVAYHVVYLRLAALP
ncbi:MAG: glycosyltransferase family 4 protein [Ramlibacter sp.]|nr:glycosyltransferase family 4 protein [Ramlibacter sp.]